MVSRLYFHLVKGEERAVDRIGLELADETALSREPLKLLRERWPGTSDLSLWKGWSVEVVDAGGRAVRIIALDDLV